VRSNHFPSAPLVRSEHVVVVIDERLLGRFFQTLKGNSLLDGGISSKTRAAQKNNTPVRQLKVDGNNHLELVFHSGLRHFQSEDDIAVCVLAKPGVEFVGRQGCPLHIFVEEPVHAAVAVEIHVGRHMLLNHCLKVFRAGRLA
jgi:hypothetical protein